MIRAVFFDLYNTLAGFSPSRFEIQSAACSEFDIKVTPDGIVRGYALADAFMAEENAIRPLRMKSKSSNKLFFTRYEQLVLKGAGVEVTESQSWDIWLTIQSMTYDLARYDDVLPAFDLLKSQGLALGMISNINRDAAELSESLGLTPYLDFTVTSREIGFEKPHPSIFRAALDRCSTLPQETVHVGDQITSDIEGALNVGINPVLLDRDDNHKDVESYPRIESLMELPYVLSLY
jgi:putative hydrolase of the HAD superfamily